VQGHFYKPLQTGPRGERERQFYQLVFQRLEQELLDGRGEFVFQPLRSLVYSNLPQPEEPWKAALDGDASNKASDASVSGRELEQGSDSRKSWRGRNAVMLSAIPRFYGMIEVEGRQLVELEDVTRHYKHPSIVDIKVGLRTWYAGAESSYIQRCKLKDAATTQAALGYKICGMQVYRHCQGGYWRASKRWCKQLPLDAVSKALIRFANNEAGLCPACVYGGPTGAIEQLKCLERWFLEQRDFFFYSSSVLLIYEGDAETAEDANVSIRLVDFAHTFPSEGKKDTNFIAGLRAIIKALTAVMRCDSEDELTF